MKALFVKGGQAGELPTAHFAVLPLGSVEYHGPYADLGTDTILAECFSDFLCEKYNCVVYPAVAFSHLPGKTAGYPGGISVDPEVFLAYLRNILSGILSTGQKNILILNAHDGNIGLGRAAAEYASGRFQGVNILLVNWWQLTDENWVEDNCGFAGGGKGHGGAFEISAALFASGDPAGIPDDAKALAPVKLDAAHAHMWIQTTPENWEGYIGAPGEASFDDGRKIMAQSQANLCAMIDSWLQKTGLPDMGGG